MRAAPKPEPQILDRQQVNGVIASGSTAASAQVTGAAPQQRAAAGATVPAAPAAAAPPLSQPSQAQAPAVAKAAPAYTLRTYDKLSSLRSPDAFGQIAGTITDSSGAAVGHAKVTLDQTSGTAHRETLTDAAGRFTISSLPPGKYRLEISSPGFTAQVREVD
ncbi:MAG TPA: carboxypeptidase-like regulatory domain-containing protein, partial [Acidobacteriaceae bacterium]|nr:carboxypeptidase-like regulatory domain-containing protein [Acidobacteriaceae bacterium]